MKTSTGYKLTLLAISIALCLGLAIAQMPSSSAGINGQNNSLNTSHIVTPLNASQISVPAAVPMASNTTVANVNAEKAGVTDVTKIANLTSIFSVNRAVNVNITSLDVLGRGWVQITNLGIAPVNLTGWSLVNNEGVKYTFPVINLNTSELVTVRMGTGVSRKPNIYTNSTVQLISSTPDTITLLDAFGSVVGSFSYNPQAVQASTPANVVPLPNTSSVNTYADRIQY